MTRYTKSADAIKALTPEQFNVTQRNGTERPGTGEYLNNKNQVSTSILFLVNPYLPLQINTNLVAAGRVLLNH